MVVRLLRHPAFLASLAVHGAALGAGVWFGGLGGLVDRPALVLGMRACDASGAVDCDAPPVPEEPPPEPPLDPFELPFVEAVVPEEPADVPVDAAPPADVPPPELDLPPVGVRASTRAPAPAPVPPRPAPDVAPSRRGTFVADREATPIGNVLPPYPALALRHRWEGVTVLDVRVTPEGTVSSVTLYQSSGYAVLDDAALAACATYRFAPRIVGGTPAEAWLRQAFRWRLEP